MNDNSEFYRRAGLGLIWGSHPLDEHDIKRVKQGWRAALEWVVRDLIKRSDGISLMMYKKKIKRELEETLFADIDDEF